MKSLNTAIVAIAYRVGHCGSFLYSLLENSPEIKKFSNFKINYNNGTAHKNNEQWFKDLHKSEKIKNVSKKVWENSITARGKQGLRSKKILIFRCHPNIALQLFFIKNLKILYISVEKNHYRFDRWAFEKTCKTLGDDFYIKYLQKVVSLKTRLKSNKINKRVKRMIIIKHFNIIKLPVEEFKKKFKKEKIMEVKIEKILNMEYRHYIKICKFLKITPILLKNFRQCVQQYNKKQWKRF